MSNRRPNFAARQVQLTLPLSSLPSQSIRAGGLRTFEAVKDALNTALKNCGLTREVVAEELSRLTGQAVSVHHVNNWAAPGKGDRSIPLDMLAALCVVTGSPEVAQAALECAGWIALPPEEAAYYELGKLTAEERRRSKKKRAIWEKIST